MITRAVTKTGLLLAISVCFMLFAAVVGAQDDAATSSNVEAIRTAVAALASGETDIFPELVADDYVVRSPLGEFDRDGLLAYFETWRNAMTDFEFTVEYIMAEGDYVTARLVLTGVFDNAFMLPTGPIAPNNQPIRMDTINVFRFNEQGQVVEEWVQFDLLGFFTQLGAMPAAEAAAPAHADTITVAGEALVSGDADALEGLFAEDYVLHSPLGDLDQAGLVGFFDALRSAMPDMQFTREQIIVEGGFAATRNTLTGTFTSELVLPTGPVAPNDQPIQLEVLSVYQFNDEGQFVEEWAQFDLLSFFTQLGVIPAAE